MKKGKKRKMSTKSYHRKELRRFENLKHSGKEDPGEEEIRVG